MQNSLPGPRGKRIVAWIILICAGLLALKLVAFVFFGILQVLFTIALIAVVAIGVLWALRHV